MSYKCHFCSECKGLGCIGEMPGMGGPNKSRNFILNCRDWSRIKKESFSADDEITADIRLAPMTGAIENAGYSDEKQFYFDLINAVVKAGLKVSIGDGTPDYKLQYGIEAVLDAQKSVPETKAAVIIKPYPNSKIIERIEMSRQVSEMVGIDIDSYNIVTMRNLVHLEKKNAIQLEEIKKYLSHLGLPFVIKGVFTDEDIELCREVKPDVIYISNHGGRVDTREGSTAMFLMQHAEELKKYCSRLWIDGGIRTKDDILTAQSYGADTVLLGRPFITALCKGCPVPFSKKEYLLSIR